LQNARDDLKKAEDFEALHKLVAAKIASIIGTAASPFKTLRFASANCKILTFLPNEPNKANKPFTKDRG
jgi:hypothetical protein